jgi:ABC-2 type transport system ATP-binding protein
MNNRVGAGVSCSDISHHYRTRLALEGVSMTAAPGEVVGLIGPNGAGKTTLIRLLTTVLPLQEGEMVVAGFGPDQAIEIRRRIGVLPESSGYPRRATATRYLQYFAGLYGVGRDGAVKRSEELLDEVGLAERRHDRIGTFSRGMKQRLGLARALINEPEVLFLDEPTAGLDPSGQQEVLRIIDSAARSRGATVILTSHLLHDVENVCKGLCILDKGAVVWQGSVNELTRSMSGSLRDVFLRLTSN